MSRITSRSGTWVVVAAQGVCLAGTIAGCAATPLRTCEEALHDQFVVISAWRHEPVHGDPPRASGIDLDGRSSDGTGPNCTDEEDFVSESTGDTGVDNQYSANLLLLLDHGILGAPPIVPGGMSAAVRDQLVRGEAILGLDVQIGLDRVPHVDVVALEAVDALALDGEALAAGQHFRVLRRARTVARCTDDALELAWDALDLPFGRAVGTVPLDDLHALVSVDGTGALGAGELAGECAVVSFVDALRALGRDVDEATVRAVAGADLDPTADPTVCDSISFGVGFEPAPATVVP